MKAWIVYDSAYGNTAQIAEAVAGSLGSAGEVEALRVGDAGPDKLADLDLLIVGSPTQKFRPTSATTSFLKGIPGDGLQGVRVAAFDTRFPEEEINKNRVLAFMVRTFGYAAQPIADRLEKKGGDLVLAAEGFYVSDTEGPLLEGELERAAAWAAQIVAAQAPG